MADQRTRAAVAAAILAFSACGARAVSMGGNGGPCVLNGGSLGGVLTVPAGAFLGGACSIVGDVVSDGVIAPRPWLPGLPPVVGPPTGRGETLIDGRLLLGPRSNVALDVFGPRADHISATQAASLRGLLTVGIQQPMGPGNSHTLIEAKTIDGAGAVKAQADGSVRIGQLLFKGGDYNERAAYVPERLMLPGDREALVGRWVQRALGNGVARANPLLNVRNAEAFVRNVDVADLAQLSGYVYRDDYSPGHQMLSEIVLENLKATAYRSDRNGGAIVIAVRGTMGLSVDNWQANFNLWFNGGAPTAQLGEYVNNLSAFVAGVRAANEQTNPSMILTGHSLGGALANIVAHASGAQSVYFNAPRVEQTLDNLASKTIAARNLFGNTPSSDANQINIRLTSDFASHIPRMERSGQIVTVLGNNANYLLENLASADTWVQVRLTTVRSLYPNFQENGFVREHSIDTVREYLANPYYHPTLGVEGGDEDYFNHELAMETATRTFRDAIIDAGGRDPEARASFTASGAEARYSHDVLKAEIYFVNTLSSEGYLLSLHDGPAFNSFLLPQFGSSEQRFAVASLAHGTWETFAEGSSGDWIDLAAREASEFRFLMTEGSAIAGSEALLALTFKASGATSFNVANLDRFGNITPVPEASTAAMLVAGLAFLSFLVSERRKRLL